MDIDFTQSEQHGVDFRTLRPTEDLALLFNIFASTREEFLEYPGWSEQQRIALLEQQFWLQHHAYMQNYENASFFIISFENKEVGRLYLDNRDSDLRIIDISLLPSARGLGIGSAILSDLLASANSCHKIVSIHVEKHNPALRLYRRLGFQLKKEDAAHYFMEVPLHFGGDCRPNVEPAAPNGPARA